MRELEKVRSRESEGVGGGFGGNGRGIRRELRGRSGRDLEGRNWRRQFEGCGGRQWDRVGERELYGVGGSGWRVLEEMETTSCKELEGGFPGSWRGECKGVIGSRRHMELERGIGWIDSFKGVVRKWR